MAKTQIVEMERGRNTSNRWSFVHLRANDQESISFCWAMFRKINPVICKGLRVGQTRKLKRTQLKNGFRLEIIKKTESNIRR